MQHPHCQQQPQQRAPAASLAMVSAQQQAPVIVHASVMETPLSRLLARVFRVRPARTCEAHYIFPTFASVAFFVVELERIAMSKSAFEETARDLSRLGDTFGSSYVLVMFPEAATAHASSSSADRQILQHCLRAFVALQAGVLGGMPVFAPCYNTTHARDTVFSLVNAHSKEAIEQKQALCNAGLARIDSDQITIAVLRRAMPWLKHHDCLVLQQGLGSMARIAAATVSEILARTPLDKKKAERVVAFFESDRPVTH